MAGLKKPIRCSCGSDELHREYQPERWVCMCGIVVRSRQTKPDKNSCRVCGAGRESKEFKEKKNLCIDCYNQWMRDYWDQNRSYLRQRKNEYYAKNKQWLRQRANAYWQSSPEAFLSDLFNRTKKTAKRRIGSNKDRNLVVEIDRDFLVKMYHTQNGLCALTNIKMEHRWSDPCSISLDRIDSSLGYTENNVQLVCQWVNLAKNNFTNADVLTFLRKYTEANTKDKNNNGHC